MTTHNPEKDNKLIDRFDRRISYLRVSLTNRCNLRCVYCYGSGGNMFAGGAPLSDDQLIRLIRIFAKLGVKKIRFTGGEPLVRLGIADLVRKTAEIDGISLIGMTTNGLILKPLLPELIASGLNRINISLDTLDKDRFIEITGINGFDRVHDGIMSAIDSGQFPIVKVNTVVIRGINDDEIQNMAEWALSLPIDLRFIEFMPTAESQWGPNRFISEQEMRGRINYQLNPISNADKISGPAKSYQVSGKPGRLSFISAVSCDFCDTCNRLRLTSDGELFGCLFGANGINLGKLMNEHESDEKLVSFLTLLISKPGFRRCVSPFTVIEPEPCMRRVGG